MNFEKLNRNAATETKQRTSVMNTSRHIVLIASAAVAASLAGCSAGMPANVGSPIVSTPATHIISGVVHGGQSAISGASVYLFAVGTGGYGMGSVSLLTSAVPATCGTSNNSACVDTSGHYYVTTSTDGNGSFSITGDYSCASAPGPGLVYLLSVGGTASLSTNSPSSNANPASYLMAPLGLCSALSGSTYITMNEVTTAAGVYALAPYMTLSATPGSSAINIAIPASDAAAATGITNAFAEAANVVSNTYGQPYTSTPAGNGAVPVSLIYSIANALATCINSNGGSSCSPLFTPTTVNAVVPGDTIAAAVSIAQNPGHNVSNIVAMDNYIGAPFAPTLASANDLTMAVQYMGNGINTPQAVAIDASGNAWITNAGSPNSLVELAAGTGSALTGSTGYTGGVLDAPTSLAIDTSGNVWVSNCGNACANDSNASSVSIYTVTSGTITGSVNKTGGALTGAYELALDSINNAWIANSQGTAVSKFNASGDVTGGSGYASTFQSNPTAVAIDSSNNAWTVSPTANAVSEFTTSGGAGASSYQGTGVTYPFAIAIDASNRPWVVDQGANSISILSAGTPITGSPLSGGGLSTPNAIALDGNGTAWITNANGSVSAFTATAAVTPATGYQPGASYANGVAVDGSGTLWVTDCGAYCGGSGNGSVFQIIGVAAPVVTPITTSKLAAKP